MVSVSDTYYKGKFGKEFRGSMAEGEVLMVYRVFYIDNKAYFFGVLTLSDNDKNKVMMKFYDSFDIEQ